MGMVGENSACAQLDASQQLHAACKYSLLRGLCAVDKQRQVGHVRESGFPGDTTVAGSIPAYGASKDACLVILPSMCECEFKIQTEWPKK